MNQDRRDAALMRHFTRYSVPGHPPVAHLVLRVDVNYVEHWLTDMVVAVSEAYV